MGSVEDAIAGLSIESIRGVCTRWLLLKAVVRRDDLLNDTIVDVRHHRRRLERSHGIRIVGPLEYSGSR